MHKSIEALEARIAPAAVFTYTEADGDIVKVKTTAKVTQEYFESLASYDGGNLSELILNDPVFQNSNLTITVKKGESGDGKASIGLIEAGVDLKNVVIKGDLDSMVVGDSNRTTAPLKKLEVQNFGGISTYSFFNGNVKQVIILGNFSGDLSARRIDAITIGESFLVGAELGAFAIGSVVVGGDMAGQIEAETAINSVRIGGDIISEAVVSGTISARSIKSINIGGSIIGGEYNGGRIDAVTIGKLVVGGDLIGGSANESGSIRARETGAITIKGSVIGGSAPGSASFFVSEIGSIRIDGDLMGGTGEASGYIWANEGGSIGKVAIGGSIIGNEGESSASIRTSHIGSITVGKSIVGGNGEYSGTIESYLGIGQLRIGGDIQGGSGYYGAGIDASGGRIGKIVVGGSLIGDVGFQSGAILAAGVGSASIGKDVIGGADDYTGTIQSNSGFNSLRIGGDIQGGAGDYSGLIDSSEGGTIGKVVIGGSIIGDEGYRSGAIRAQEIGSASIRKDVVGGANEYSGSIEGAEGIGLLRIGGDLQGGAGYSSGEVRTYEDGSIDKIVIAGSIIGSSGEQSGTVAADHLLSASVGGSILGGSGVTSGTINVNSAGKVSVARNVTGGAGDYSGSILGDYGIVSAKIGKDLTGGGALASGSVASRFGSIGSIAIGGNVSNEGEFSGIFASKAIGNVTIGGDATGSEYGTLEISAGSEYPANSAVPAIGSVNIKGNVTNLLIGAGMGQTPNAGSIGSVKIGGNFTTSSIVAGVAPGDDGIYGTIDDVAVATAPGVVSRIASVVIGKSVIGSSGNAEDSYGIIAHHIAALKVKGAKQQLEAGPNNDLVAKLLGGTDDVYYVELPIAGLPD